MSSGQLHGGRQPPVSIPYFQLDIHMRNYKLAVALAALTLVTVAQGAGAAILGGLAAIDTATVLS